MLALAHVFHQMQLGESAMPPFQLLHEARNHADDFSFGSQRPFGQSSHQSQPSAAIHHGYPGTSQDASQFMGGIEILLCHLLAGGAINTDPLHRTILVRAYALAALDLSRL